MALRQKFASQLDADLLAQTRALAKREGRHVQSLLEEALLDLLEKRRQAKPRPQVMALYEASVEEFGPLYERLAK